MPDNDESILGEDERKCPVSEFNEPVAIIIAPPHSKINAVVDDDPGAWLFDNVVEGFDSEKAHDESVNLIGKLRTIFGDREKRVEVINVEDILTRDENRGFLLEAIEKESRYLEAHDPTLMDSLKMVNARTLYTMEWLGIRIDEVNRVIEIARQKPGNLEDWIIDSRYGREDDLPDGDWVVRPKPNFYFTRDHLTHAEPNSFIINRMAKTARETEQFMVEAEIRAIRRSGVPVLRDLLIKGRISSGYLEGGDCFPIEFKDTSGVQTHAYIIGLGNRTSTEGARQLIGLLESDGREYDEYILIEFKNSSHNMHLDTLFGPIGYPDGRALALLRADFVYETEVTVIRPNGDALEEEVAGTLVDYLESRGIEYILIKSDLDFYTNYVQLGYSDGGRPFIISSSLTREINWRLESKYGVDVFEIDATELKEGNGDMHCMTQVLRSPDVLEPLPLNSGASRASK